MAHGRGKIPTCKSITDAPLKRACEETFDACKKLPSDGAQASCAFQATRCIDNYLNNRASYPVETRDGNAISFSFPDICLSLSLDYTRSFGPLARFKTAPSHPAKSDSRGSAPNGSMHKRAGVKAPVQEICDAHAGPKASAAHESCIEKIGICMSDGPFHLSFGGLNMSYPDSESCIEDTFRFLNIPSSALPKPPEKTPPIDAPNDIPAGGSRQPDGKTRFEVALDYTNFAPETGSDNESETTLLARYGDRTKKLDVKIRYSLEETGSGQYRMKYTILGKGEEMLNGERTIEFEARDGKITDNLVFAITLGNEGDFSTASSVEIVKK